MREILFRGKRIDNGEWVTGFLVNSMWYENERDMSVIIPIDNTLYPRCQISSWEEVISDTVGQYTGLKDIDGTRIFEGDILENPCRRVGQKTRTMLIFRDIRKANSMALYANEFRIIGNVHDDPELLEELNEN